LPQSFGKFRDNFTLRGVVCDPCNQHLGDCLELYLGRDTFEGQLRFRYGFKSAKEFKSVGQGSRLIVRCTEGQFAGCYMLRYFSQEKNDISVRPLPQVGLMLDSPAGYRYFLLDEIPTHAELIQMGFDRTHSRPIVGLEVDAEELKQRLAERGIEFHYRGALAPDVMSPTIECELEGSIDHVIFRAVSKIAFNYLAYWEGAEFVQHAAFDPMRRYIRWGHVPDRKLIHMDEVAILDGEPIEGPRRLGHIVTVNWAADGVSILAQVSVFNWMTYRICLAPDFSGPPPELTRGHFFNVPGQEILELGSRPTSVP
jgi:hypothetical protein